jgi:hypothetical protein
LLCSAVVVPVCVPVAVPGSVDGVAVGDGDRLRVRVGFDLVDVLADGLALGLVFFADGDGDGDRLRVRVGVGLDVAFTVDAAEVGGLDTRLRVGLGPWGGR